MSMVPLFEAQYAATSFTTVFTAPSATVIDAIVANNVSGADVLVTIALVPLGDGANTGNAVMQVSVPSGQSYLCPEPTGQVLAVGGSIAIMASVASSIVVRGSGRTT